MAVTKNEGMNLTKIALVMQMTAIILLSACLTSYAAGFSQKVTLSVKNEPVQKVFKEVSRQTGVSFIYNEMMFENIKPVNIDVKDAELEDVIGLCLQNQPFSYSLDGKVIMITPTQILNAVLQEHHFSDVLPPPITIRGRIVNENGEPVVASVVVKGTKQGVTSGIDGSFEIAGVENNAIITVTAANIETTEIKINGRTELLINVKIKVNEEEEVIVKTNYWETKQKMNPGNISKVTAKEIEKQPVSNPIAALQANVPGLEVTQTTGVPGGGFKVRIRGTNSIANGNNPLYVVDGVPYTSTPMSFAENAGDILGSGSATFSEYGSSPLNNINPSDIESIEILKDADATAVYGSRGANGVVLITTKKGKAGKTKVDLNFYTGVGKVPGKMDLLSREQYLEMRREAFQNDNITPDAGNAPDLVQWDTTRYTDWQKELIGGSARYTDVQATVSGGEANTHFLMGGAYHKETTVYPGDNSDRRMSAHATIDNISFNRKLKTMLKVNFSSTMTDLLGKDLTNSALTLAPIAPALYKDDGTLSWDGWSSSLENPLAHLNRKYEATTNTLISNFTIGYTILPGLELKTSLGYTHTTLSGIQTNPISSYEPSSAMWQVNQSIFSNSNFQNWVVEPQLNWKKKAGKGTFDVLLGTTILQQKTEGLAQYAEGYSSEALMKNLAGAPNVNSSTNYYAEYRYNAGFGRINYTLLDRYTINLTGRRDGSSRFGPGKQFANFGAIGTAWIFSEEAFIQKALPFISYGKLRVSYGSSGNDQLEDYQYLDAYSISGSGLYQTGNGLNPARLSNPDYSWETNKKFETGFELGVFKDKIIAAISYYNNRSSDQLVGYPLAPTTGFQSIQGNFPATVENTGFEVEINTRNISKRDFGWTSSFNISVPKNKLVSFPGIENFPAYQNTYVVGKPLNIRKTLENKGVDPLTGIYNFVDVNNDGSYNSFDRQIVKFVDRKFYGGLQNSLRYKGFQFSFLFQFVKQYKRNYVGDFYLQPGGLSNQPSIVMDRWKKIGDNKNIQFFTTTGTAASYVYSDLYYADNVIIDASFVRLKNVAFSWDFPTAWLRKMHFENAGIFIHGQNLLTFTDYMGLDPEVSFSLPPLRVITCGIRLTF